VPPETISRATLRADTEFEAKISIAPVVPTEPPGLFFETFTSPLFRLLVADPRVLDELLNCRNPAGRQDRHLSRNHRGRNRDGRLA